MNHTFPKQTGGFLKAESFQDQEVTLTFKGWEKRGNEDRPAKGKMPATTWKQTLKYALRYSYPEFVLDEAGERVIGKNGQPWKNANYDPAYPHGYTIIYSFEEGTFESGSFPLWKSFCMVQPAVGDRLVIGKTGEGKETKWKVKKVNKDHSVSVRSDQELPEIQTDDFGHPAFSGDPEVNPDGDVPF